MRLALVVVGHAGLAVVRPKRPATSESNCLNAAALSVLGQLLLVPRLRRRTETAGVVDPRVPDFFHAPLGGTPGHRASAAAWAALAGGDVCDDEAQLLQDGKVFADLADDSARRVG